MNRIRKKDLCAGCGQETLFIKCLNGKTIQTEAEAVYVRHDPGGEFFITDEGILVWGEIIGDAYDRMDDPDSEISRCYEPHRGKCPNGGRKRRRR